MKILLAIIFAILNLFPGVQVVQDSTVSVLLDEAITGKKDMIEVDGYRVQIYSSNKQQTAKAEALEMEEQLKEQVNQTIYVQYVSPFWKVRIGAASPSITRKYVYCAR
jgi:hypothetical protein